MHISGVVVQGHQVASGRAEPSPFPAGTIELQAPMFVQLGLDLSGAFMGTINVSVEPFYFRFRKPDYTFTDVKWTDS